ncbi:hypothetical protein N7474_003168 [Penicillium riverlandense]|uniref:uncharacterized protein n=1 Tax=Penicillium riverlandense TaxID=1903569 RepID=UPI0025466C4D|nr:uncharacterized protein N7474_003168 [Penicillium riverlandense]KAJ5826030.1 hypothetical protein N7474_003168 [Penicillium riverlandense]
MASLRLQGFPSLLRGQSRLLRNTQRRWAQVHDARFLASHHDPNHVLDKYRSKLDQKAKQEGHQSIESLKDAYSEKIQEFRQKASTVVTPETGAPSPKNAVPQTPPPPPKQSPTAQAARAAASDSSSGVKPLDSFVDVEKIRELPPKEIEALWRLRHANNPTSICAVIPLETYQRIAEAARHNPQFILPLPRQQTDPNSPDQPQQTPDGATATTNADIHFLHGGSATAQAGAGTANTHTSTVIFTGLGAYKMHGSFAQPHTTVTHHLDLADDKGLVLMHGQVMPDSGVSTTEATWLVSCVQRFYDFDGQASGRKGELVRMFTRGDVENFKVEELLEETERVN